MDLLSLVLKNWKLVAIGGLAVLLVTGFGIHKVIVADWKSDLADEEKAHGVCKTNVTELTGALDRQNEALRAFQAAALAKQAEADRRAQEARERASRDRQREMGDDRAGAEFMNQWMAGAFQ